MLLKDLVEFLKVLLASSITEKKCLPLLVRLEIRSTSTDASTLLSRESNIWKVHYSSKRGDFFFNS